MKLVAGFFAKDTPVVVGELFAKFRDPSVQRSWGNKRQLRLPRPRRGVFLRKGFRWWTEMDEEFLCLFQNGLVSTETEPILPMLYIYLYLCVCLFPMVFQIFLNLGNQQLLVLESCLCETPRVLRCTVKHCPQRRLTVHLWSFDELFSAPSSTFSESGVPRRTVAMPFLARPHPSQRVGVGERYLSTSQLQWMVYYWIIGLWGNMGSIHDPWNFQIIGSMF